MNKGSIDREETIIELMRGNKEGLMKNKSQTDLQDNILHEIQSNILESRTITTIRLRGTTKKSEVMTTSSDTIETIASIVTTTDRVTTTKPGTKTIHVTKNNRVQNNTITRERFRYRIVKGNKLQEKNILLKKICKSRTIDGLGMVTFDYLHGYSDFDPFWFTIYINHESFIQ